ncbi:hypothetical protein ASD90_15010 [Terrabacter sp. Root181]|nr:hypothetical protein ASD90_15010 [Terrabacter sp. Root181]
MASSAVVSTTPLLSTALDILGLLLVGPVELPARLGVVPSAGRHQLGDVGGRVFGVRHLAERGAR